MILYLPEDVSERLKKQIDFLVEIDKAKTVFRKNLISDGSRTENDAEHMWHMALMSMILSEYAAEDIDQYKVLRLVLIHDLVEIYAGDTFAYDAVGYMDKEKREIEAADKLFSLLPDDQNAEIRGLWEEFETMATKESQFANAIDRINPMLWNHLTDGHTWKLGHVTEKQVMERIAPVKTAAPEVYKIGLYIISEGIKRGHIKKS